MLVAGVWRELFITTVLRVPRYFSTVTVAQNQWYHATLAVATGNTRG